MALTVSMVATTLLVPATVLVRVAVAIPSAPVVPITVVIWAVALAELKTTAAPLTGLPPLSVTTACTLLLSAPLATAPLTGVVSVMVATAPATKVVSILALTVSMVATTLLTPDWVWVRSVDATPFTPVFMVEERIVAPLAELKTTAAPVIALPLASCTNAST
ncbi:hypothetical protein DJ55_4272 [Yersinia pseudotuberculosis]|nr:hypothetical protein DJ55_4272 [Yersinia pseudotuberculosis]